MAVPQEAIARALEFVQGGATLDEAARRAGCSVRTLYRARKAAAAAGEAAPEPEHDDDTDPSDPIAVLEALRAKTLRDCRSLPPSSPRLNGARQTVIALTKSIESLKDERRRNEQDPAALERAARVASGETVRAVEEYVQGFERRAAQEGRCVTCGALAEHSRPWVVT